ncbi:MAG TPA: protein-L-isoaspartate(D-aspartate) O-methyltransferase [Polyangiaceae bacterium]|nr:protein-L-isoaspartate(D-aspartate) O-methyltransferase [Polyangiaceae bacterium]
MPWRKTTGGPAEASRANDASPASETRARHQLVQDIEGHAEIHDPRILAAFERVPRHLFLPQTHRSYAYRDSALPIGFQQTISQPSMIAIMLEALELDPQHRVLEVGAGSGYAAALLGELVREVHSVEIVPELAEQARARLQALEYRNIFVHHGNGRSGWWDQAPYDRILVSAGAESVPPELIHQLVPGGILVMPIGDQSGQRLLIAHKDAAEGMHFSESIPCIFVPLVSTN